MVQVKVVERAQKHTKPVDISSQRALSLRTAEDTSEEPQTVCTDVESKVHPARFELATSGFVNRLTKPARIESKCFAGCWLGHQKERSRPFQNSPDCTLFSKQCEAFCDNL